jgi:uncharacterized protein YecE (DUF72 family)
MRLGHNRPQIRIGCSGWQYKHWKTDFYPADLPQARWFAHYALAFDTVEINNSFYRLPAAETFAKWREQAPAHFLYAVKASRFLTHMKKLKDPEEPLFRFFENARALGSRLGPILYQLPPNFGLNLERLETFLRAIGPVARRAGLRSHPHHVIEFRDPSWYDARVYALLERYAVSLCVHDMRGSATGQLAVGPCAYVRYHFGTSKYGGRYDDGRLDRWADWLVEQLAGGRDVFAYFNNDTGGHAPRDAVRLRDRIHVRLQHAAAS